VLQVTPAHGRRKGRRLTTVLGHDGAIVAGQPEVAASWFPVNDHPIDKASSTFVVTAPADLEVVANGRRVGATALRPAA
jgi:aminopeptidase N